MAETRLAMLAIVSAPCTATLAWSFAESGRPGRAKLPARKGASGRMQRPTELVPIPTDPYRSLKAP